MAAITRNGDSLPFTAITDTYAGIVCVNGITFQGTGLTAGQRVLLQNTSGDTICDYVVEAATDNADLYTGRHPKFYQGIKFAAGAIGGSWVLTVFTE